MKARLQAVRASECSSDVARDIDFKPWLEVVALWCRRPGRVASIGLRHEVQTGTVRKAPIPHHASGVVDYQTVSACREHDIPGRWIRAAHSISWKIRWQRAARDENRSSDRDSARTVSNGTDGVATFWQKSEHRYGCHAFRNGNRRRDAVSGQQHVVETKSHCDAVSVGHADRNYEAQRIVRTRFSDGGAERWRGRPWRA